MFYSAHLPLVNDTCEINAHSFTAHNTDCRPGEGSLTRACRPVLSGIALPQHFPKIIPTASRLESYRREASLASTSSRQGRGPEDCAGDFCSWNSPQLPQIEKLTEATTGRVARRGYLTRKSRYRRGESSWSKNIVCGSLNSFLSSFHVSWRAYKGNKSETFSADVLVSRSANHVDYVR